LVAFDQDGEVDVDGFGNLFGVSGAGFDTTNFDQDEQQLATGLSLNELSGWLNGSAPAQVEPTRVYQFKVTPYNIDRPGVFGETVQYELTVLGEEFNEITWLTGVDLGVINEGQPCTVQVEAESTLGHDIEYSFEFDTLKELPQGLKLTTDGYLVGRPTFRRFSVDAENFTWCSTRSSVHPKSSSGATR
jgi:hypothetical protein